MHQIQICLAYPIIIQDTLKEEIENSIRSCLLLKNIDLHFIQKEEILTEGKQLEKQQHSTRIKQGMQKSKKNGNVMGCRVKDDVSPFLEKIKECLAQNMHITEISKCLNVNYSSLYTFLKNNGLWIPNKTAYSMRKHKQVVFKRKRISQFDSYQDLIVQELKSGKFSAEIARSQGWNSTSLNHYIRKHGLRNGIFNC